MYVPVRGVIMEEPAAIRYERRPWIEGFEFDGIRPAPVRREGFGQKSIQGFLMSLGKVYDDVMSDYGKFDGEEGFDAEGFFGHVTERMIASASEQPEQFRRFAGFTENMWRLGDEPSYDIAMDIIVPRLMADKDIRCRFEECITEEFKENAMRFMDTVRRCGPARLGQKPAGLLIRRDKDSGARRSGQ